MKIHARPIIAGFLLFLFHFPLFSQSLLRADTIRRCIYDAPSFGEELYRFDPDPELKAMVKEVWRASGVQDTCGVYFSNVPGVAGIIAGDKHYLLFNESFWEANKHDKHLMYAMIGHEIGHFTNRHKLSGPIGSALEETAADFFMGHALRHVEGLSKAQLTKAVIEKRFARAARVEDRLTAIENGWRHAEAEIMASNNGSFFEENKNNASLPLPRFPWPPPKSSGEYSLPQTLFQKCNTLRDIDARFSNAMDEKGYSQRSYFYVPNGFAVITQLEQFSQNGLSKSDNARWVDYPVQENFGGVIDYLKSIILPCKGNFRVFAFIVTDAPFPKKDYVISKEEAIGWLSLGGSWLPDAIGQLPFSKAHRATLMVYEFEATTSDKKSSYKKPGLLQGMVHFDKSGLGPVMRK